MSRLLIIFSLVFVSTTAVGFCAPAEMAGASAPLAITQTTQIPGETLKAGDYSISIVDQLADRMIVRIDSKSNSHHAIFLGVQTNAASDGNGPVLWQTGLHKAAALRGFNFTNGKRVEFVYPKAEAAALAKENSARVIAVDPASEGHSAALKNLSQDELQTVNLWMLSLTTTGVNDKTPAILAQRYEGPVAAEPVVAVNKPVPAPPAQVASVQEPAMVQPALSQRGGASKPVARRTVIAQLPHTGSYQPLVWLAAMLSLLGAGIVRVFRGLVERRKLA